MQIHSIRKAPCFLAVTLGLILHAGAAAPDSTTAAKAVKDSIIVGQPAPNFKLMNQEGGETQLKDYLGKWVVLYFYPKDFTGGCTLEAHNFQRDSAQYDKANAVILGVSVDKVSSHKDFCAKEGLRFKLLADTSKAVCSRYGSLKSVVGFKIAARNTFLIDPQGKVAKIFWGVKPAGHSEEVLAALAALKETGKK